MINPCFICCSDRICVHRELELLDWWERQELKGKPTKQRTVPVLDRVVTRSPVTEADAWRRRA